MTRVVNGTTGSRARSPYSVSKLAWHREVLEALRLGKTVPPIFVQWFPTGVCNASCSFCLVAGTLVETARGSIPIESVRIGDEIRARERTSRVTEVGHRRVHETLVVVGADGSRLRLTAEHPVYTPQGWVEAGDLVVGSRIASSVRLRLRNARGHQSGVSQCVESLRGSYAWAVGSSVPQIDVDLGCLDWERVAAVLRVVEPVTVYNLSCDPWEEYEANGVLVHNCSYASGPLSIRKTVPNPPLAAWKNAVLYSPQAFCPLDKMLETVAGLREMGCRAIEITGGGEPGAYPHFEELVAAVTKAGIELALVTNGTLLDDKRLALLQESNFVWVRVSVDAGSEDDYVATRYVPRSHWQRAWDTVRKLSLAKRHPEASVGVGFVLDRGNADGVYAACALAKKYGADNIRLSTSFTPDGTGRWQDLLDHAANQAIRAKEDLQDEGFKVHDLIAERAKNVQVGRQNYPYCAWKDVACVIGHDLNVYACCSWAMNPSGVMFSIEKQSFRDGWMGQGAQWRREHDPRRDCRIWCLMEYRNKEAIRLMMDPDYADLVGNGAPPTHVNFV